jgi:hypothetical protein
MIVSRLILRLTEQRRIMKLFQTVGAGTAFAAAVIGGMMIVSPRGQADYDSDDPRIQEGFAIAPVYLNMQGRTITWWAWAAT